MAYNPASDSNCQAWWRLEDGALTTDSSGKGNTLTNSGVSSSSTHQEGSYSGECDGSSYLAIADASLSASFPGKSGTSAQDMTICCWFRPDVVPGSSNYDALIGKYVTSGDLRTWNLRMENSVLGFTIGYSSGTTNQTIAHVSTLTAGRWYHVGVTYNASTRLCTIRIWDDTGGAILGSDVSSAFSYDMSPRAGEVRLGSYNGGNYLDGLLDDVVVFNRVLTTDEIDEVRNQTFGSGGVLAHGGMTGGMRELTGGMAA